MKDERTRRNFYLPNRAYKLLQKIAEKEESKTNKKVSVTSVLIDAITNHIKDYFKKRSK